LKMTVGLAETMTDIHTDPQTMVGDAIATIETTGIHAEIVAAAHERPVLAAVNHALKLAVPHHLETSAVGIVHALAPEEADVSASDHLYVAVTALARGALTT
jgi:nitrate reductase beta subunit